MNRIGLIVGIIALVLLSALGAWYFLKYKPDQKAKEQARLEQIALEEEDKRKKEQAAIRKAKYDQLIKDADGAFNLENLESARSLYAEAASILKNQTYPKDQLALIDERLNELAAIEARKAAGIVETITSPTNLFYVILSSSIDDDLAMDNAKKLIRQGEDVKIIEHEAPDHFYYRIALGNFETREQAQNALSSLNGIGNSPWVLNY